MGGGEGAGGGPLSRMLSGLPESFKSWSPKGGWGGLADNPMLHMGLSLLGQGAGTANEPLSLGQQLGQGALGGLQSYQKQKYYNYLDRLMKEKDEERKDKESRRSQLGKLIRTMPLAEVANLPWTGAPVEYAPGSQAPSGLQMTALRLAEIDPDTYGKQFIETIKPERLKAPEIETFLEGGEEVQKQWDPVKGEWIERGRGQRWESKLPKEPKDTRTRIQKDLEASGYKPGTAEFLQKYNELLFKPSKEKGRVPGRKDYLSRKKAEGTATQAELKEWDQSYARKDRHGDLLNESEPYEQPAQSLTQEGTSIMLEQAAPLDPKTPAADEIQALQLKAKAAIENRKDPGLVMQRLREEIEKVRAKYSRR